MVHIDDVLDPTLLAQMREQKMVHTHVHPDQPLLILNYTRTAQYKSVWNEVTTACRGIIVHAGTGEVLARPFGKFFNYGESEELGQLHGPVHVTDKADGSLGILFHDVHGSPTIATRGSFTGEQATHATAVYRDRYASHWSPNPDWTYLFEIVYPDNRIVLNYGAQDDLVLLTAIETATGHTVAFADAVANWPGPVVETFGYSSLAEALAAPDRDDREGLVVHFTDTDIRVKVKYTEYKRMHRLLTGCSARTLWEHLAVAACKDLVKDRRQWGSYLGMDPARAEECLAIGEGWLEKILDNVPDEFDSWVRNTTASIEGAVQDVVTDGLAQAEHVKAACNGDREAMFHMLTGNPVQMELMRLLTRDQGQFLTMRAWRMSDPGVSVPFFNEREAA